MERDDQAGALRWHFNGCVLDESSLQLSVRGALVELERKPLEVLRYLLRHAGEVVTKDEVLEAVWPGRILSDTVLAKAISRLREVLGETAADTLKTVHGYGYRLVAEVRIEQHSTPAPKQASLGLQRGDHPPLRPNWVLVAHLESGGRGEVWRIQHEKNPEQRVLKFALDEAALGSLKREITLNRLLRQALGDAAAVTPLLDWNLQQPPFFVELPYLPQGSLADWAAATGGLTQIPLATRLDVAAQIAEAVSAAHGVGVLHKDLKPANVLVTGTAENPRIQLTDFGSGAVLELSQLDALGITRMGLTQAIGGSDSTSGTPLYFAPEVLAGQPHTVKSDHYALGVLLYQLVVGDFRKPLSPGWERDISDPLLCQDIALAADGNPQHRLGDAAELARRIRSLAARHEAREREQAQQALLAASQATALENQRLRQRRRTAWAFIALATLATLGSLALYFKAQRAEHEAIAQAQQARAVSGFFNDDLLGLVDARRNAVKDVSLQQVLRAAVPQVAVRLGSNPLAASQVYQSIASGLSALGDRQGYGEVGQAQMALIERTWQRDRDAGVHLASTILATPKENGLTIYNVTPEQLKLWQDLTAHAVTRQGPLATESLWLRLGLAMLEEINATGAGFQPDQTYGALLADAKRLKPANPWLLANIEAVMAYANTGAPISDTALRQAAHHAEAARKHFAAAGLANPIFEAQLLTGEASMRTVLREFDAAKTGYQRAKAIVDARTAPGSPERGGVLYGLTEVALRQHDGAEFTRWFTQYEREFPPDLAKGSIGTFFQHAYLLSGFFHTGQARHAVSEIKRLEQALMQRADARPRDLLNLRTRLAMALAAAGDANSARALVQKLRNGDTGSEDLDKLIGLRLALVGPMASQQAGEIEAARQATAAIYQQCLADFGADDRLWCGNLLLQYGLPLDDTEPVKPA